MSVKGGWIVGEGYATSFIYSEGDVVAQVFGRRGESAIDCARLMAVAPEALDLLDRYASDHEMRGEAGPCSCALCREWRAIVAQARGEG